MIRTEYRWTAYAMTSSKYVEKERTAWVIPEYAGVATYLMKAVFAQNEVTLALAIFNAFARVTHQDAFRSCDHTKLVMLKTPSVAEDSIALRSSPEKLGNAPD